MMKKAFSVFVCIVMCFSLIAIPSSTFAAEKLPTEIMEKRTEFEKHFDNGDGTFTSFVNSNPLHCYEDGEWVDIDNTLILNENGDYVNKCNSMHVSLSARSSANDQDMIVIEKDQYRISWGLISDESSPIEFSSLTVLPQNSLTASKVEMDNKAVRDMMIPVLTNQKSKALYTSIFDSTDIEIVIEPSRVKETIIVNNQEAVQDSYSYFIDAGGLDVLQKDDGIHFYDAEETEVFMIPALFMFDSSESPEYCTDIESVLSQTDNGYILTVQPSLEWLLDDERVYPVYIDPTVDTINSNIVLTGMSSANPTSQLTGDKIKVGTISSNDKYEAYVKTYNSIYMSDYANNTGIINAKLYVGFSSHTFQGEMRIYSYDNGYCYPYWNSSGGGNGSITSLQSNVTVPIAYLCYVNFDITKAVQAWLNYEYTQGTGGGYAGVAQYGFRLETTSPTNNYFECFSSSGSLAPYYEITYANTPAYRLENTNFSYKYDDYDTSTQNYIQNFQRSMNCYAFALQVYYRGPFTGVNSGGYHLKPGEIGMQQQTPSQNYINTYNTSQYSYNASNYGDLSNKYSLYESQILSAGSPNAANTIMNQYRQFVEEQMDKDAQQLGFTIQRYIPTNNFSLPSNYNENNERIIALITYVYYSNRLDYHYFMRNGNGTCQNPNHPSTCSLWTHKRSMGKVETSCTEHSHTLCDQTIHDCYTHLDDPDAFWAYYKYNNEIRYYRITQDAILYNMYLGNGHQSTSTGTPYYLY